MGLPFIQCLTRLYCTKGYGEPASADTERSSGIRDDCIPICGNNVSQHEASSHRSQKTRRATSNLKSERSKPGKAKNCWPSFRCAELAKHIIFRYSFYLSALLAPIYVETDSDATNCYMFFQRLAAKADVINTVVAHVHGLPDSPFRRRFGYTRRRV